MSPSDVAIHGCPEEVFCAAYPIPAPKRRMASAERVLVPMTSRQRRTTALFITVSFAPLFLNLR
jgi:hypothetical protein